MAIRAPAVAGFFYPDDPVDLERDVRGHLEAVPAEAAEGSVPKALIAPHAGYVYSGTVAAHAYARLAPARERIRRVVLLGPSHRVPLRGLAVSAADAFETPLGAVPVDRGAVERVLALPQVESLEAAHRLEHSLEVHLPFLQVVLGDFRVVPIAVGEASPEAVAEVIEALWGGDETLVVVSSDLSHYYDYATARRLDAGTTRAIESLDASSVDEEGACGCHPVRGLLVAARRHGLSCTTLDVRNSGDTAGPRDRVVGYGSYAFA